MGVGGGSWEWRCNLCKKVKTFKGSYTSIMAHILHEGKGIVLEYNGCARFTIDNMAIVTQP
jgi:hypothetical protein